jgi:hypothetical protein
MVIKKGHCILLHNKETVCSGLVLGNSMFAMLGGLSGMTHSCEEAHSGTRYPRGMIRF